MPWRFETAPGPLFFVEWKNLLLTLLYVSINIVVTIFKRGGAK
ncbi:hypothetical protein PB1_08922 [Bacillus methanolicus PB1]|uniref:Uncharacterized protein n=1 Tax=Bacillus methanolicus PB1 TaxID=997296 RepID=I3E1U9_BACMT|nr:hypothetical protein PB1_08922 [Bacillus methanolicus PB1]